MSTVICSRNRPSARAAASSKIVVDDLDLEEVVAAAERAELVVPALLGALGDRAWIGAGEAAAATR